MSGSKEPGVKGIFKKPELMNVKLFGGDQRPVQMEKKLELKGAGWTDRDHNNRSLELGKPTGFKK